LDAVTWYYAEARLERCHLQSEQSVLLARSALDEFSGECLTMETERENCLRYAAECLRMAERCHERDRADLLQLAEIWRQLADEEVEELHQLQ
jgi:hypothetical protein